MEEEEEEEEEEGERLRGTPLLTTKPCSPGEKTRQPCTHLVSSGPSIRRRGSLFSFPSLSLSLSFYPCLIIVTIRSVIGDCRQLSNYRHLRLGAK